MTNLKALGKAARRGISLTEIARKFGTDELAEEWFTKQKWPVVACPQCESDNIFTLKSRKPQPCRSRTRRKHFYLRTGPLLRSSNAPLSQSGL